VQSIGVAEHDKVIRRFPNTQERVRTWFDFEQLQQGFVAREIARRVVECEIKVFHEVELLLLVFYCLLN
jgi:hypothetical protein